MTHALRWQILLPRVLLAVVLVLAVQYGLGLATRSRVVRIGEAVVGAPVALAHARVSLVDRQVVLSNLRIVDPCQAGEYLLEADRCELHFNAAPLLRKQAVIERGSLTGIRLATPREADEAVETEETISPPTPSNARFDTNSADAACKWLDAIQQQFETDHVRQLQSVALAEALCRRWPEQAKELRERLSTLSHEADELHELAQTADANPLRHAAVIRTLPERGAAVRQAFAQLAQETQQLPDSVEVDRRAIVAARRHDEQQLGEQLHVSNVDADALSAYLLGRSVAAPVEELIAWLRLVRQLVPANSEPWHLPQRRGQDVFFAGCERTSGLVVRELDLLGTARIGGQQARFQGKLANIASLPASHGQPMRVQIATDSPRMTLQVTIDRTGAVARDSVEAQCDGVLLPATELGDADRLVLAMAPSLGKIQVRVSLEGDTLAGEIEAVQQQARFAPRGGGDFTRIVLGEAAEGSLDRLGPISTRIALSGTLSAPKFTLSSNLGSVVAEALAPTLRRASEQRTRALASEAQQRVDEMLTNLDRQMAEDRARLMPAIVQAARQLDTLAQDNSSPLRRATEEVVDRDPADTQVR